MTDPRVIPGGRNPERRLLAEEGRFGVQGAFVRPYRKVKLTYAVQVDEPFDVATIEGMMHGNAGDWLAVGPEGELYPIAASVFATSYVPEVDGS